MTVTCKVAEGTRYEICCTAFSCGEDLCVTCTGGTRPHIGAVSLAVYEPERGSATVSTLTAYTHRDDVVAAGTAKRLSRALRCTVTVAAGIHIDDPSEQELRLLQEYCDRACAQLLSQLQVRRS